MFVGTARQWGRAVGRHSHSHRLTTSHHPHTPPTPHSHCTHAVSMSPETSERWRRWLLDLGVMQSEVPHIITRLPMVLTYRCVWGVGGCVQCVWQDGAVCVGGA